MKSSSTASPDKTHVGIPAPSGNRRKPQSGDYMIQFPDASKEIDFRIERPRPGMSLSLLNDVPMEDIVMPYEVKARGIIFSVRLSGQFQHKPEHGRYARIREVTKPYETIFHFKNRRGEVRIKGGVPHRHVSLSLQTEVLEELIGKSGYFDPSIIDNLQKERGSLVLNKRPPSPDTSLLADQVLNCPMTGPCRDMYMEAKALEMIALFLHHLADTKPRSAISLSRSDVERLHGARDILLTDLAEPPSIRQLAKRAGINEFKLKKGFREVFGCTVYEALRIERLNMANNLLRDSDMTVAMVSATVGYTNIGHFIALFRKQFGVTPGSLLQQARRNIQTQSLRSPTRT